MQRCIDKQKLTMIHENLSSGELLIKIRRARLGPNRKVMNVPLAVVSARLGQASAECNPTLHGKESAWWDLRVGAILQVPFFVCVFAIT